MTDDPEQSPRLPNDAAARRLQLLGEQLVGKHRLNMDAITAQITPAVLADIERTAAAAKETLDAMVSRTSKGITVNAANTILAHSALQTTMRNQEIFRLLAAAATPATIHFEQFEQFAVEANFAGEGQFTAEVEVVGTQPAAPSTGATIGAVTSVEWIGAVCVLAQLNDFITAIRDADLLDAGQLALVIAALIAIVACGVPPSNE